MKKTLGHSSIWLSAVIFLGSQVLGIPPVCAERDIGSVRSGEALKIVALAEAPTPEEGSLMSQTKTPAKLASAGSSLFVAESGVPHGSLFRSFAGEDAQDPGTRLETAARSLSETRKTGETVDADQKSITKGVFTKIGDQAVLPPGPSDDGRNLKTDPAVVKDGDTYKMWYGANQDGKKTQLFYAESGDGIKWDWDWEKRTDPVLTVGEEGSWDAGDVETPTVIIDQDDSGNKIYKMWYSALDGMEQEVGYYDKDGNLERTELEQKAVYRIGYATSGDGVNWNKHKDPVLGPDVNSTIGFGGVADPVVIKVDGTYKMWYSASGSTGKGAFWIGHATSKDGIDWEEHSDSDGELLPVLDIDGDVSSETEGVGQPDVLFNGKFYEMWYSHWKDTNLWDSEIGYATSQDGMKWKKVSVDPVLGKGQPGAWDSDQVFATAVLLEDEEYKMWYSGRKDLGDQPNREVDSDFGIGFATMPGEKDPRLLP